MGKFNSSTTRVAPVFSKLYADDTTGASWLPTLLNVGTREQSIPPSSHRPSLVPKHGEKWGVHEMALPAPLGLLEHLIQSVTLAQVKASGDQGDVLKQRLLLAARDRKTVNDALREVRFRSPTAGPTW